MNRAGVLAATTLLLLVMTVPVAAQTTPPPSPGPTVTVEQAPGQPDPASGATVEFIISFSEPMIGFSGSGVYLTGTTAGANAVFVTGGPQVFTAEVSGMSTPGDVIAIVPGNQATSQSTGQPNQPSTSSDNVVAWAPLTASFSGPTEATAGTTTSFFDTSNGDPYAWDWSVWFDDSEIATGTDQDFSFVFPDAGTYDVELTVTWMSCGECLEFDTTIQTVTVTVPTGGTGGAGGGGGSSGGTSTPPPDPEPTDPGGAPGGTENPQPENEPEEETEPPAPGPPVTVTDKGRAYFGFSSSSQIQAFQRTPDGQLVPMGSEINGEVVLRYDGPASGEGMRFMLIPESGPAIELGRGREVVWPSTGVPNGVYTIQVERIPDGDFQISQSGYVVEDRTTHVVRNPEVDAASAAGAVVVGVAVVSGASVGAQLAMSAGQAGQEAALGLGEDVLRGKTEGRISRLKRWGLRFPTYGAVLLMLLLMAVFFTFEGVDGWSRGQYLAALPVVGAAAVFFTVLELTLETFLAWASGVKVKVRLLGAGIISLVVTALFVRTAVGYPGFVDEQDVEGRHALPASTEAMRAGAVLCAIVGTMVMFLIVGMWHFDFMMLGLEMSMAALIANALPLSPLPGHDVWKWNKAVSIAIFLTAFSLFVVISAAWLSLLSCLLLGTLGLAVYASTLIWLRKTVN